jgi:hypothetical protein
MENIYQVAGGWQAQDEVLHMACFGPTAADAKAALDQARERGAALVHESKKRSDASGE